MVARVLSLQRFVGPLAQQLLGVVTPQSVALLLSEGAFEVEVLWIMGGFCTRVADVSTRIQLLCTL